MSRVMSALVIALLVIAGTPAGAGIPLPPDDDTVIPCDFVTGGGWIRGFGSSDLAEGAKANFGVGGGVKNGAFWGHLQYNDHSTRPPMRVHGTSVTGYFFGEMPNERTITGTARIDGVDGFTYTVAVTDNAEPGRGIDEFSIFLSNGYAAGFRAGDGPIGGGNIQLHKGNRSNTPPPGFICAVQDGDHHH